MEVNQRFKSHQIKEKLEYLSIPEPNTGCILWTAGLARGGYASTRYCKKTWRVSRLIWTIKNGPIPFGMLVCHKCDTPACINIDHLFLGSSSDNAFDKTRKKRDHHSKKTHCSNGHPYDLFKTGRRCRECTNRNAREWYSRQSLEYRKKRNVQTNKWRKEMNNKKKAKLGSGERFKAIERSAAKSGAKDPAAVAAAAGIKKYGQKKMTALAQAGKKKK